MKAYLEYLLEKGYIDISTLQLNENKIDNTEGLKIAKAIGVLFNGWWEELGKWTFTDNITKSTFTAIDLEEAKRKLEKLRSMPFKKEVTSLQPA